MTKIYIDTNIIMNESYFRSPFSRAFLKACSLLKVKVIVPDIVLDEVLGNYPKKIRAKAKEIQKAQKEISKLTEIEEIDIDVDEAFNNYEIFLLKLIDENGVHVAPYPEVSTKDLVTNAYNAKKPFKETGEGHKDVLVWETIKEDFRKEADVPPHYFLTNNTKDFAMQDDDKRHILHSDLAAQLDVPTDQLVLLTTLRAAWESLLAPHLEGMTHEDLPDLSEDEIAEATSGFLLDDLPERTAFGFENLPFSNDVSIVAIGDHTISAIQCTKVDDAVIIKVTGSVEIEVTGFIEKFAYYQNFEGPDPVSIEIIESDWNDHVMHVGSMIETDFELSIVYSLEERKIVGREIALPQEIADELYH